MYRRFYNRNGSRINYIILFFHLALILTYANNNYISKFGNEILATTPIVARGKATKNTTLNSVLGTLVHFKIEYVYWGKLKVEETINLHYPFSRPYSQKEWVVFLKPLSASNTYKIVGEFSAHEKLYQQKVERFEKILLIENLPRSQRQQPFIEYCLAGLQGKSTWMGWNAFYEWEYLTKNNPKVITQKTLQEIVQIYKGIPELKLKLRLSDTLLLLKKHPHLKRHFVSKSIEIPPPATLEDLDTKAKKLFDSLQKEKNIKKKVNILNSLVNFPGITTRKALVWALHDPSTHIRALSLFYLKLHGSPREIPYIHKILNQDPSLRVRKNAILALAALKAIEAHKDISAYIHLPYTRRAALKALKILKPQEQR